MNPYQHIGIVGIFVLSVLACACQKAVLPVPEINRLSPSEVSEGEPVFVIGEWMQVATTIEIEGDRGSMQIEGMGLTLLNSDSLFFLTPSLPVGVYQLRIFNADDEPSEPATLTIKEPRPIVQGTDSTCTAIGDTLCILGINFSSDSLSVQLGTTTLTEILSVSSTEICVIVPVGLPNTRMDLLVGTSAGISNPFDFIVCAETIGAPTIISIEPDTASIGDTLLITGENFILDSTTLQFPGADICPAHLN